MIYAPGPSRRRAFAKDSDRIGAPEPAHFLDVRVPVPFACAERFSIAGLIDELKCYLSPLSRLSGLPEAKSWPALNVASPNSRKTIE